LYYLTIIVAKFERYVGSISDVLTHHPSVVSIKRKKSRIIDNNGFINVKDLGEINFGKYAIGEIDELEDDEAVGDTSSITPVGEVVRRMYILKCMSKQSLEDSQQIKNAMNEAKVLASLSCPFICKLHGTYQTMNEIVLVLHPITGGDLWSLIHQPMEHSSVLCDVNAIKFYAANIIIALEHMHSKDIAFRNLKPENVLIDASGYLVLIGLGLAKKIPYVSPGEELKYFKSFTLCGTAGIVKKYPYLVLYN
jgi:serine/threonine protein kinase